MDFGIAGSCTPNKTESTSAGSLAYMPPEVITHEDTTADAGIDVWALGCMIYAMLLGRLPFYGETQEEFEESITTGIPNFKDKIDVKGEAAPPPALSAEVVDLIMSTLEKDPKKRINMFQILEHKWLNIEKEELEKSIEESKAK